MTRLIYVMGASGVGKDSLLGTARARHPRWLVAHRYITRDSDGAENCVALSAEEFAWRRRQGLFCLDWPAHGMEYGIGLEVETWLAREQIVLVNGSRRALPQARARFGERLLPVLVTARAEVLRERLMRRGRESLAEIEARLARHRALAAACSDVACVDNSGTLTEAVAALEALLTPEYVP